MKRKNRVICFIDGFSLYHAVDNLNEPKLKWLNLWELAQSLTHKEEKLTKVYYFSAYATWKPDRYARHRKYVRALKKFGVTPVFGHFKSKTKKCKNCGRKWIEHEEKETDVQIALQLLQESFEDQYERAIIISSDSDLLPAIKMVLNKFETKSILVAPPPGRFEVSRGLRQETSSYRITKSRIRGCLLPEVVTLNESEAVECPEKWKQAN